MEISDLALSKFYRLAFGISVLGVLVFIADFGFTQTPLTQNFLDGFYFIVLILGIAATLLRYFRNPTKLKNKVLLFDFTSVLFTSGIILLRFLFEIGLVEGNFWFQDENWLKIAIFLTFIREFSEQRTDLNSAFLNPAQLFISSFLVVTLIGGALLTLPNATHGGISFTDALFTSTSAVCVTGLAVVDTGKHFTLFGQTLIMLLIQIGGLGILTFASYFSYFFKGGTSYENQLTLSEMTSSQKIGEVFNVLKYIILITAVIEGISAVLIFTTLDPAIIPSLQERLFFSVFHSISAFCNAGFSTLSNSLYESDFRFNYGLQFIVTLTFIFGGLGFPIVVNIVSYFKYKLLHLFSLEKRVRTHRPWVLNLNSRITLITTLTLTAVGFFLFFVLEYNNTLAEHRGIGKVVTAFFGAATPRTAGFNSVNMAELLFPTVMVTFFLMWVGASPASTGGGIKTSTFAIATLNLLSLAKGKTRIEVFRREIADISVRRAFATISASLIIIGFGIMLISIFDPEKGLLNIAFECFSAYSTVGLSLGITGSLSAYSKFVLIGIMFVGRVSMLSIIIAVFPKTRHKNYRYPTEEITIN